MKVAIDIAQTAAERAGCAWYASGLAEALARIPGIDLELHSHFGEWVNTSTFAAVTISGVRDPMRDFSREEARRIWKDAASRGLDGRPGIVHSNSFQAPAIAGSRLVFTVHDVSFWTHPEFASESTRSFCQAGMLDALERAAGFVFTSRAAHDEFETMLPGWLEETGRPWAIVPGASRFKPEPERKTPGRDAPWLCVGSIEPRKNHATLLDAYETYRTRVPDPHPLLLIGGDGWHSEDIHRRIDLLEGTGLVRHPGYVSDAELADAYRSAFALIQPSWHEGFGLPVVEAFGFGLPVICSDIPSLREVGGDAVRFFPPGDAPALANAMVALHADVGVREHAATESSRVAIRFSWEASAQAAVGLYRTLLKLPPRLPDLT